MTSALAMVGQKVFRLREAFDLIFRHAADADTKKTLFRIYKSLGDQSKYSESVTLNLKFGPTVLPCHMRLSDIFVLGEILFENQYALQSDIPKNGTIIDAGGNVGLSGLWLYGVHSPSSLHIFEPEKENFSYLNANFPDGMGVTLNRCAVGEKAGELNLNLMEFAGMHSLKDDKGAQGAETVKVIALADYMQDHDISHVDLLKIDIEGSELDALKGLGDRIADVAVIVGEVHEDLIDVDGFYRYLTDRSFEILWKKGFQEGPQSHVHNFEARLRT